MSLSLPLLAFAAFVLAAVVYATQGDWATSIADGCAAYWAAATFFERRSQRNAR
jgi:hypothetical protein